MSRFIAAPRDTGRPAGTVPLWRRLFHGDLLSASSTARLIAILEATETGPGRITLPRGAGQMAVAVYLKSGTCDLAAREMIIAQVAKGAFDSFA